jgi:hypothetical protein
MRRALMWFFMSIVTLSLYIEMSDAKSCVNLILAKALSSEIQREKLKRAAF